LNERIINKTGEKIKRYAAYPEGIEDRLKQLDQEWDMERMWEANASNLVIIGIILGTFVWVWLYLISLLVGVFLLAGGQIIFHLHRHLLGGW